MIYIECDAGCRLVFQTCIPLFKWSLKKNTSAGQERLSQQCHIQLSKQETVFGINYYTSGNQWLVYEYQIYKPQVHVKQVLCLQLFFRYEGACILDDLFIVQ